jgi:hypothetical protein
LLPSTRQSAPEAGCVAQPGLAPDPRPHARVRARPRAGHAARTVRRKVLRTSGDGITEGHGSAPCPGTRVLRDLRRGRMRLRLTGPDSPERKGVGNGDAGSFKDLFDQTARHLATSPAARDSDRPAARGLPPNVMAGAMPDQGEAESTEEPFHLTCRPRWYAAH